ncbi:hypothetical protein WJX74_009904 [Apatococcus lobatus]|uniref:Uncharacterized protein n=1 Tax=Apatococcus lobatus TaxID=904363 RepID=A0AAW1QUY6_9CHLO
MNCTAGSRLNNAISSRVNPLAHLPAPSANRACFLAARKRAPGTASRPAPPAHRQRLPLLPAGSDPDFDTAEAEGIEEAPEDARGAIAVGLKFYKAGNYQKALELFGSAPGLPGTGTKRFRDKPAQSSDGEKMAALYNIACCHAQLGNMTEGLLSIAETLKLGYSDINQIRSDPDLERIREDSRFEQLLLKFKKSSRGGLLDNLMRGI